MLFSPSFITFNDVGKKIVLKKGGWLSQSITVIPRSETAFRRYSLKNKKKSSVKVAELQARVEARKGHDAFTIVKDVDQKNVSVWSYDSANVIGLRSLPESLCHTSKKANGSRLLKGLSGFEGQIWKDGDIIASRWWNDVPTKQGWTIFLQSLTSNVVLETNLMPNVEVTEYRGDLPWISIDLDKLKTLMSPAHILTGLASVFLFFTGQYLSESYLYEKKLIHVQAEQTKISHESNKILSHRRQAFQNLKTIQNFNMVDSGYSLIEVIAIITQAFDPENLLLQTLKLQNHEIEIRFKGTSDQKISDLVAEIEKSPLLKNVTVTRERNGLLVKSQINHKRNVPSREFQVGSR